MRAASLAAELEALERGLEGLLSCFESQRFPAPEAMDAAWRHVLSTFEDVRAELARAGGPREAERERLDHCLRLYAVAAGVLAQRRAEVAAEREACSRARQRLRGSRPRGESGSSCDVRG